MSTVTIEIPADYVDAVRIAAMTQIAHTAEALDQTVSRYLCLPAEPLADPPADEFEALTGLRSVVDAIGWQVEAHEPMVRLDLSRDLALLVLHEVRELGREPLGDPETERSRAARYLWALDQIGQLEETEAVAA